MGKSTVLQSLLLLRQSFAHGPQRSNGLMLNGELISIGSGKDALCQDATKEEISFTVSFVGTTNARELTWIFAYNPTSDILPFEENVSIPDSINEYSLFNTGFQYLNAERWVRNQYAVSGYNVEEQLSLGVHGEFTPHFLEHFGSTKKVNNKLWYPGTSVETLNFQVSAWMSQISPGTNVKAEKLKGLDLIRLGYEFTKSTGRTSEILPLNVGFGLTYALPIVVALLSAKPGDVLLIENPESHLHPYGQAAISRIMSLAAENGVQIFVESHSDHIINGILVSINQRNKTPGINSEKVSISYFDREPDQHTSKATPISIQTDGRIKNPPPGFFDQFANDISTLIGF